MEAKTEKNLLPLLTTLTQIPWSDLKVGELLGEGSYGTVHHGQWQNIEVAIKQLHLKKLTSPLLEDFKQETVLMAKCRFPYVIELYGVCTEVNHYALVMTYLPKGSLCEVLHDTNESLPWNPIRWEISIEIGKGLAYLHGQQIVHRDLKSLNVLLDSQYHAKISDFGMAKLKLQSSSMSTQSRKGTGTTRWLAPELFKRGANPNFASDVYSYGMVLWEIASRQSPYQEAQNDIVAMGWIKDGEKENIPIDCPIEYGQIIQKTWMLPEARPSANEISIELEKVKPKSPPKASPKFEKVYEDRSWHFDSQTKQTANLQGKDYVLIPASPKDIQKVIGFYVHHPVPGYEVSKVEVIYNPGFNRAFELHLRKLQKRDNNPAFVPEWLGMPNAILRQTTYNKFTDLTKLHTDPDYPAIKLLPAWHGTKPQILDSLFSAGYASLGTTDAGFFGRGYYSAYEAKYSHRVYSKGALILNWVASFSPLPVVDNDMKALELEGKGNYDNYDAHFVPVAPRNPDNPNETVYYPCKTIDEHQYTEMVVFDSAALLPRYLVELQPEWLGLKSPSLPVVMSPKPASPPQPKTDTPQKLLKLGSPKTLSQQLVLPPAATPILTAKPLPKPQSKKLKTEEPEKLFKLTKASLEQPWLNTLSYFIKDFAVPLTIEEVKTLHLNPIEANYLKDWLWSFVEQSKVDEKIALKASLAMTTLNAMGVAFIGKYGDCSHAKIPGANLSGAMLSCTLFKEADLREAILAGAYLGNADFSQANLMEVKFGEFPTLSCNESVECICYSPDGHMMAVGEGYDIILYRKKLGTFASEEHETYEKQGELKGHTRDVTSVAFSPDGKQLASGSNDETVRLWNPQSLQSQGELKGHTDAVMSVAFSPDGIQLASGSSDSTVRLWNPQSLQSQGELKGHTSYVQSVAFSPDGKQLASGSWDCTVRLWDLQSLQSQGELKGHGGIVHSVAFSPDGKRLASGSNDNTVRLWDPQSLQSQGELRGHTSYVYSVAFSPDGKRLASGSWDNTVRLWDPQSLQSQGELQGHTYRVMSVAFSPDGKQLASGSSDKTVRLWDPQNFQSQGELKGHTDAVMSVAFSPDGIQLASGSSDSTVRLWNPQSLQSQGELKGHTKVVHSVAYSPDGIQLASGSWDNTVRLWNLQSLQSQGELKGHTGTVFSVAFSPPDGKRLASGSWDETVRLWDPQSLQSQGELKGHKAGIDSVAFSPDGKRLASASGNWDCTVRLWDPQSLQSQGELRHTGWVNSVVFSPDGKQLASGSSNTVHLWDPQSLQSQGELKGHTNGVTGVDFSPDGKWLASSSNDHTVRLWHLQNLQSQGELKGHTGPVNSVAFSPDGKWLASGSQDCAIFLWTKTSDGLLSQEKWALIYRFANSKALLAPHAFLKGAKISDENLTLLKQRGANDDETPDYQNNPHAFWAKQRINNPCIFTIPTVARLETGEAEKRDNSFL